MRVLQLAPIWETVPPPAYGGTETVVNVLTEELVRQGIDVTLCASGDSTTRADFFSVFPTSLRPAGLFDEALQYSLMHVAKSLAKARDYDIVHVHNIPDFLVFSALVPKLTRARLILDIHDLVPELYAGKFGSSNRSIALRKERGLRGPYNEPE